MRKVLVSAIMLVAALLAMVLSAPAASAASLVQVTG